ncbi:MAG: hypothetical protein JWO20_1558 [Candidatus Angelobacter sp.]|nr:hypothetical protein [Candidatus Angelobacter sp.]
MGAFHRWVARRVSSQTAVGAPSRLALRSGVPFWQARYYDLNVWSERKRIEKLRYMHRNPVKRGLAETPEDWEWSSFSKLCDWC